MKPVAAGYLALQIGKALISASNPRTHSWTPSLEHVLHTIGCRHHLTPSLVATVIDPYLLTHHSLALGFFHWASQQPNYTHTPTTFHSILKSLSLTRQHSNTIDSLLKQAKALNFPIHPSILSSIIGSYISGSKTQKAFCVYSNVVSLSSEIGSHTFNSLLAALASDGYLDGAHKVFEEMTVRGVELSTLGFGVFVWRVSREGDLKRMLSVLDEVRECGSWINGSVMAVLMVHGLCCAGRLEDAL